MYLKNQAVSGLKWSSISKFGGQFIQFITLIILARLLDPEDFGLMASAMVVIGFVNVFRDLGLSSAIIQKKEISIELFSSVFWLSVISGIILMLLLIIFSVQISYFFNAVDLIPIIRVLAIGFVFSGFSILQQALLEKELRFKLIAKFELFSIIISAVIGISFALNNYGVWSLVFQNLAYTFIFSLLIGIKLPQKPRMIFKWSQIKSVANFSLNLSGFNILNYFVRNADYILIQKYLGAQSLGYYTLAYRIMLYPLQNISGIFIRVMYPVFSKIQDDNKKLQDIFLKIVNSIALLSFPLMLGLFAISDNFITVVFGMKWQPVITLILILSPLGLLQSVYTPAGLLFQTKARTDLWFKWGLITGILFVSAFWFGLKWGISGVAIAYLIVNLIVIYPGLAIPFKLIELKVSRFLHSLSRTFIISFIMFVIIINIKLILNQYLALQTSLIIIVLLGIIIYLAISLLYNKERLSYIYFSLRS